MSDSKVKELWGRKFDVVNEGLDESQVTEFVDVLIHQRDTLLEQVNSLLSYIRHSTKNMGGKEDKLTDSSRQQVENRAASIVNEVGQDTQARVETVKPEQVTQPVLPEATKATEADKKAPTLYQGELELAILPPINAAELLQFERRLRNSFQLKILSTHGSPSKGSLINVMLNEQQPLLQSLKQMPEVKEAVEKLDIATQANGILPFLENNGEKRIWVTLGKGS